MPYKNNQLKGIKKKFSKWYKSDILVKFSYNVGGSFFLDSHLKAELRKE